MCSSNTSPATMFHELDLTVYEFVLCKKHHEENAPPDSNIIVVWEGANGTRSLKVRRLPQSKRPWIALLEDKQSGKVLTSRTASSDDDEAKSAADMLVDLAKKTAGWRWLPLHQRDEGRHEER